MHPRAQRGGSPVGRRTARRSAASVSSSATSRTSVAGAAAQRRVRPTRPRASAALSAGGPGRSAARTYWRAGRRCVAGADPRAAAEREHQVDVRARLGSPSLQSVFVVRAASSWPRRAVASSAAAHRIPPRLVRARGPGGHEMRGEPSRTADRGQVGARPHRRPGRAAPVRQRRAVGPAGRPGRWPGWHPGTGRGLSASPRARRRPITLAARRLVQQIDAPCPREFAARATSVELHVESAARDHREHQRHRRRQPIQPFGRVSRTPSGTGSDPLLSPAAQPPRARTSRVSSRTKSGLPPQCCHTASARASDGRDPATTVIRSATSVGVERSKRQHGCGDAGAAPRLASVSRYEPRIRTRRTPTPAWRRTPAAARMAVSAHCRSSRTTTSGASLPIGAARWRLRRTAGTGRPPPPMLTRPRPGGAGQQPARLASATGCRPASIPRSTCVHSQYGGAPAPFQPTPRNTRAPRLAASRDTSASSADLPMPGSPADQQHRAGAGHRVGERGPGHGRAPRPRPTSRPSRVHRPHSRRSTPSTAAAPAPGSAARRRRSAGPG